MRTPAIAPPATDSLEARQSLTAATLQAATFLDISQADLGKILGLSPATVSRMANQRYLLEPAAKEWQLAALFIRLFRSLDSITGGRDDLSRRWLSSPNRSLSATPLSLLVDVAGLVTVVQYLDSSRAI